jgi:hypothetical protein
MLNKSIVVLLKIRTKLNSKRDICVLFHPIKCKKGKSSVSDFSQNLPTNMAKLVNGQVSCNVSGKYANCLGVLS